MAPVPKVERNKITLELYCLLHYPWVMMERQQQALALGTKVHLDTMMAIEKSC
jgi:hypothetical protein